MIFQGFSLYVNRYSIRVRGGNDGRKLVQCPPGYAFTRCEVREVVDRVARDGMAVAGFPLAEGQDI